MMNHVRTIEFGGSWRQEYFVNWFQAHVASQDVTVKGAQIIESGTTLSFNPKFLDVISQCGVCDDEVAIAVSSEKLTLKYRSSHLEQGHKVIDTDSLYNINVCVKDGSSEHICNMADDITCAPADVFNIDFVAQQHSHVPKKHKKFQKGNTGLQDCAASESLSMISAGDVQFGQQNVSFTDSMPVQGYLSTAKGVTGISAGTEVSRNEHALGLKISDKGTGSSETVGEEFSVVTGVASMSSKFETQQQKIGHEFVRHDVFSGDAICQTARDIVSNNLYYSLSHDEGATMTEVVYCEAVTNSDSVIHVFNTMQLGCATICESSDSETAAIKFNSNRSPPTLDTGKNIVIFTLIILRQ